MARTVNGALLAATMAARRDRKGLQLAFEKLALEESFLDFFIAAWPQVDPAPLKLSWHHEAIAEHLEAIMAGEIRRLLIMIPPRCSKSLLVNVAFPAWIWARRWRAPLSGPQVKFLCLSFAHRLSHDLATTARRLILSQWYQERWGEQTKLSEDQSSIDAFSNVAGGMRMAGYMGGLLGRGADCVTGDTLVQTRNGFIRVDNLEIGASPLYVLSYDEGQQAPTYRRVIAVVRRGPRPVWRIQTAAGRMVKATADHRFLTKRGWIPAASLAPGDVLLCSVPSPVCEAGERDGKVGQTSDERAILQFGLPYRGAQPSKRLQPTRLCDLRREIAKEEQLLLRVGLSGCPLPRNPKKPGGQTDSRPTSSAAGMRDMRQKFSPADQRHPWTILLAPLPRQGSFSPDEGSWQPSVPARAGRKVRTSKTMVRSQAAYLRSRQLPLRCLQQHEQCGGPSHQFYSDRSSVREPDLLMQEMPQDATCSSEVSAQCDSVLLAGPIGGTQIVYDIQVEGTACFFANCILVHNCRIVDDPLSLEDADSEIEREKCIRAYDEGLATRATDPSTTAEIIIMQRLHQSDLAAHVMEKYGAEFTTLWAPMRFDTRRAWVSQLQDPAIPGDPRTEEGELLWPEQFPAEVVDGLEARLGPYGFSAQQQQLPVPRGGGIILRDWWRLYPDDAEEVDQNFAYRCRCGWERMLPNEGPMAVCQVCRSMTAERRLQYPEVSLKVLSVDTAYGEKEENSYSAATCWGIWHGKEEDPRAMLMEAWRGRPKLRGDGKTLGLVEIILNMARRRRVETVLIERKTRAIDLYNELERLMVRETFTLEYFEPTGRGDKSVRLHACVPMFTNGIVWAPNKQWADDVISEVSAQPRASYSDYSDTCSQFMLWARDNGILRLSEEHKAEVVRRRTQMPAQRSVVEEYEGA